jgi:hypothetical protein
MLDRTFCLQQEIEVDLVKMTVAELGFEDGALHADICAEALKLALELCPAEVGPALRLQYGDQLDGERLRIGMRPLVDHGGIFSVDNENGRLWLSDSWGRPGFYSADYCFVFVVP